MVDLSDWPSDCMKLGRAVPNSYHKESSVALINLVFLACFSSIGLILKVENARKAALVVQERKICVSGSAFS